MGQHYLPQSAHLKKLTLALWRGVCAATTVTSPVSLMALSWVWLSPTLRTSPPPSNEARPRSPSISLTLLGGREPWPSRGANRNTWWLSCMGFSPSTCLHGSTSSMLSLSSWRLKLKLVGCWLKLLRVNYSEARLFPKIFKVSTNRVTMAGEGRRCSENNLPAVGEPQHDVGLRRQQRPTMNLDVDDEPRWPRQVTMTLDGDGPRGWPSGGWWWWSLMMTTTDDDGLRYRWPMSMVHTDDDRDWLWWSLMMITVDDGEWRRWCRMMMTITDVDDEIFTRWSRTERFFELIFFLFTANQILATGNKFTQS